MNIQSAENIISTNNQSEKILKIINNNLTESDEQNNILYSVNKKEKIKNYKNNPKYIIAIEKIAKILKHRVKFPKCKIFKFYLSYRTLILRIADGIKKTAKIFNFWEKWENNITEQEIKQIQEIASTACKIIQKNNSSGKNKKSKNSFNDIKNRRLSLFKKNKEKEEKEKKSLLKNKTNNEDKSKINQIIISLKNISINEDNINIFIKNFSHFLENNNIHILQDTKLPNIINKKYIYLLNQKEFWIKYIIFVSHKYKNELTIYHYINFIEQFYIWNNNGIYDDFNMEIKNQINTIFNTETINNFLLNHKINNLDEIFERYKNIHINNNYIETKINDEICDCPTCKNNGFLKKMIDYNKKNNEISYAEKNNLSFLAKKENIKNKIEDKYYDIDVLVYLNSIEKRKKEEENKKTKKYRNSSNKKRSYSTKKKYPKKI